MTAADVSSWRKAERSRLIAAREGLDAATRALFAPAHRHPSLALVSRPCCREARLLLADPGGVRRARLTERLRERGAVTALPVVVAPGQALVFREWHPGVALAPGPHGIPQPAGSDSVDPTAALVPMNGWDEAGYRLGYGGGFFDRTLASLARKPVVIGVSYELARMKTIRPRAGTSRWTGS